MTRYVLFTDKNPNREIVCLGIKFKAGCLTAINSSSKLIQIVKRRDMKLIPLDNVKSEREQLAKLKEKQDKLTEIKRKRELQIQEKEKIRAEEARQKRLEKHKQFQKSLKKDTDAIDVMKKALNKKKD